LATVGLHHLSAAVTNRQILVQRVYDRRIGQRIADLADKLVTEEPSVLKVDDVGPGGEQKVAKVSRVQPFVGHRAIKRIKTKTLRIEEVLVGIILNHAEKSSSEGPLLRQGRAAFDQQLRLEVAGRPHTVIKL